MKAPIEPKFVAGENSQLELMQALNYYAAYSEPKYSKAWAIEWAQNELPDAVEKLHKIDEYAFKNRGFVCRMIQRGYKLSEKQLSDLKKFIIDLEPPKVAKVEKAAPPKKVVKQIPAHIPNAVMQALDPYVDDVIRNWKTIMPTIPTGNQKDIQAATAYYERSMEDLMNYPDYFRKDQYMPLKRCYKAILEELAKVAEVTKQQKTRRVVTRKVNPAKMTKYIKFMKEEPALKIRSMSITSIIGAKKLYAYDTKARSLILWHASTAQGFTFQGTSLKNFDPSKSVRKTVRKPEELFHKYNENANLSNINKLFNELSGKDHPMSSGRSNENLVYLIAS